MTCLVTGGTGFIGSHIVCDLVREGEQVVIYDLFPSYSLLEKLLNEEERACIEIVRGDVNDLSLLIHTAQDNNVDKIIHLVSLLTVDCNANPALAVKVNCDGTVSVFETARILKLKKVVWASSIAVFGPQDKYPEEYIPNDAPHYPFGIYGACKSFNEKMTTYYSEQYALDICALRYPIVYSRGVASGIVKPLIEELVENPSIGKPSNIPYGDDIINWLYVEDASRATVMAANASGTKTKVFNLSGDVRPVSEVADYVKKLLPGADINLLSGRVGVSYSYDTTLLEEEIGFKMNWSMEQGIKELINKVRREKGLPSV
jgi:UDP-glucuronate 4-epimerase